MQRYNVVLAAAIAANIVVSEPATGTASDAGLLGKEFSLQVQYQLSPTSEMEAISFLDTQPVSEVAVEFPNAADLQIEDNRHNLFVVDVSIDVGSDFIAIGFEDAGSGRFADGFFNGYAFIFDSVTPVKILSVSVDTAVTSLGIDDSNLTFTDNILRLNVATLSYSPSTFARINISTAGDP